MTAPKRWTVVCVVAVGTFAGLWGLFAVFGFPADVATQVAGVIAGVISLPLAAWASAARKDGPDKPTPPVVTTSDVVEPPAEPELDDADITDFRSDYLQRIRHRFEGVELDVLTPPSELEEATVVPLATVFVGQLVKEGPRPMEPPREIIQRPNGNGGPQPRELPEGISRAMLARILRAHEHQPSIPVLPLLARDDATRVVLLGDPGSGKSTLAKYVAYTLADVEIPEGHPLEPLAGWLPIVIELRDYARHGGSFLDYLDGLHLHEGLGLPKQIVEDQLRRDGKVLLIFDGLDEIFDHVLRDRTMTQIEGLAARNPRARFIVTSRTADYQRKILEPAGFRRYQIQDLDRPRIGEFIDLWYHNAHPANDEEAASLATHLIKTIDSTPPVAELAGNPMLLTILAIIARRRPLPRDRASVYEHAVTVLVEQWDIRKLLPAHDSGTGQLYLDAKDKLEMLRLIARRMHDSPAGLSGNFISGADLKAEFADFLRQRDPGRLSLAQARHAADLMLVQFHQRNFILSRFGDDVYGFVHRSFLEYLAAADIVHRFNRDRTLSEEDLIDGLFGRRWRDPAWHEVLLLTAGMLGEQFVNKAVLRMLAADPHWAANTLVEPHHILLAVRCIGEVRRISPLTDACKATVEAVIQLLTVAHRRITRAYSDALARAIERSVPPVFATIAHWPGRQRYLAWYTGNGQIDTDDEVTSDIAARLAATMLADDNHIFDFLCTQAEQGWSPHTRAAAAWAVATGWRDNAEGLTLVRERATADTDHTVRERAMRAVATSQPDDPRTLALLRDRAINDEEMTVRRSAVTALATGWRDDPATLDLLRTMAVDDPHHDVRRTAVEAIAEGWPRDAGTEPLLRTLITADTHDYVRRTALRALATVARSTPGTLTLLQDRIEADPSSDVRQAALWAVATGWPGDPTTLPLLRTLAVGPRHNLRHTAVRAIGRGWHTDEQTMTLLRDQVLADASPDVRQAAVETLAAGWHDQPGLLNLLRDKARTDPSGGVREAAVRAVARFWRDSPDVLPWLHNRALHDDEARCRAAAVEMVAIGWHDQPDTETWLHERGAEDTSPIVRAAALRVLATDWSDDDDTLPWLRVRAEDDTNDEVRHLSLRAIADDWPTDPGTLELLRKRATVDPSAAVRHTALDAVTTGWHDDPATLELLRERARQDPHSLIRSAAISAIGSGWHDDPATLDLLRERARTDEHPVARRDAIRAIADGWHDATGTLGLLTELAENDPHEDPRLAAVDAIATGWHSETARRLLHRLATADQHPAVRSFILQSIVGGWPGEPDTLMLVRDRLVNDDNPAVRAAAAHALRDCWPDDPATLDLLRHQAQLDDDESVRQTLVKAVAELEARTPR